MGERTLFEGFRTGTLNALSVDDDHAREVYSENMFHDLLRAIVAKNVSTLSFDEMLTHNERAPLMLKLCNIDLQLHNLDPNIPPEWRKEARAVQEQYELLQRFHQRDVTVELQISKGTEVQTVPLTVHLDIASFNLSVYQYGFEQGCGFSDTTVARNLDALRTLRSWTSNHHFVDEQTDSKARLLLEQLSAIVENGAYALPGEDPYKAVSRAALLTHLLGGTAHWNCRSGKDRTGWADAEIKLLSLQLHLSQDRDEELFTPDYTRPLHSEESEILSSLLLNGGGMDVLRLNTGVPGYKMRPYKGGAAYDPWIARIGGPTIWPSIVSLSEGAAT